MRHRKTGRNFGRPAAQRKALFRNLIISLVEHEQIKTTLPKANELGPHYQSRPGGYLRLLKCGYRAGDNAPMAIVQLVDRQATSPNAPETVEE